MVISPKELKQRKPQGSVVTPGKAGKIPQFLGQLTPEDFLKQESLKRQQSNLSNVTQGLKSPSLSGGGTPLQDPAVVKSGDTGAVTGITFPDNNLMGSNYFGNLPAGHAQQLLDIYNQRLGRFKTAKDFDEINREEEIRRAKQRRAEQLAAQVGQGYNPALASTAGTTGGAIGGGGALDIGSPIDMKQTFLATITDPSAISTAVGSAVGIGFAAKGATVGGVSLGPLGALAGGLGGLALGMYTVSRRNVASQRKDTLSAQRKTLTDNKEVINQVVGLINVDPENADKYIELYNEAIQSIDEAYQQAKYDTQTDLNLALSEDGTTTLAEFENFYMSGGRKEITEARIQAAVSNPDADIGLKELMLSEQNIMGENANG